MKIRSVEAEEIRAEQTDGHNKAFHDYMRMHRKLQAGVASSGIMFKPKTVKTFKWFKS